MRVYYQVETGFKLTNSKPSLVSLSLHSTLEYHPLIFSSYTSRLTHSRYFFSLPEAHGYIKYLYSRFPDCTVPYPVLDAKQLSLF